MASISALASPCSAVEPLPKLPPLSPDLNWSTLCAGAEKLCWAKKLVFIGRSASIRSSFLTTPVSGLTCFRNRATVVRDDTVRYPPLVMISVAAGPRAARRRGPRGVLRFFVSHGGGVGG